MLLTFILISILINVWYRPFIYKNQLFDFGIADIGNNLFFIPIAHLGLFVSRKKFIYGKFKDIIFHFLILSIIEILSYFIGIFGVFDFKDLIGLFLGAILTFFISFKNDF